MMINDSKSSSHQMRWLYKIPMLCEIREILKNEILNHSNNLTNFLILSHRYSCFLIEYEAMLRCSYEANISNLCRLNRLRYRRRVQFCAQSLFKRFYLNHSIIEYNPNLIAKSSIYLATKIKDNIVENLEDYCLKVCENSGLIRSHEMILIDGILFDLHFHTPDRIIKKFFVLVFDKLMDKKRKYVLNNYKIIKLNMGACRLIEAQMLSDLLLEYSPSHLALAALSLAFEGKHFYTPNFPKLLNKGFKFSVICFVSSMAQISRKLRSNNFRSFLTNFNS